MIADRRRFTEIVVQTASMIVTIGVLSALQPHAHIAFPGPWEPGLVLPVSLFGAVAIMIVLNRILAPLYKRIEYAQAAVLGCILGFLGVFVISVLRH